jgi:hypothetical protein
MTAPPLPPRKRAVPPPRRGGAGCQTARMNGDDSLPKPLRKPKLAPAQYAARFAAEKLLQQRRYCDAFRVWRTCRLKSCRRNAACRGDANACLKRAIARVPRIVQWQTRQTILEATPANLGAPERAARQCMPLDFYV